MEITDETTIEDVTKEELKAFQAMSPEELIEEIYRLRICMIKKNCALLKEKKG